MNILVGEVIDLFNFQQFSKVHMVLGWSPVFLIFMLWDGNLSQERISAASHGSSHVTQSALSSAQPHWECGSESGSDSDPDRPDPDIVLDDLATRRFHSPSPAPPTNFAVPVSPSAGGQAARRKVTVYPTQPIVTCDRSENVKMQCGCVYVMRDETEWSSSRSMHGLLQQRATSLPKVFCL